MKEFRRLIALILSLALIFSLGACKNNNKESSTGASSSPAASSSVPGHSSSAVPTSSEPTKETLCEELSFAPNATSLFVDRAGNIKTGEVTDFDNSSFKEQRYDEAGLRQYVTGWIKDFNEAKGKEAIKLDTLAVADKKATLIMSYDTVESFMEFQGEDYGVTELRVTSVEDAAKNYQLSALRDKDGKSVSPLEAVKNDEYTVVVVSGNFQLTTSGPVAYLSNALTLTGPNTVRVNTKNLCYIIFK